MVFPRGWVRILTILVAVVLFAGCATPTPRALDPAGDRRLPTSQVQSEAGGRIQEFVPPSLERVRTRLLGRLDAAHERHGRGRPPATGATLGELGVGARQGFVVDLLRGRCYSILAVTASDDQEIDLALIDERGEEYERQSGHEAVVELCPTSDVSVRVLVRMYRGSGPFVIRVFGS